MSEQVPNVSKELPPITMSAPDIDASDLKAVEETLRSGVLGLGPCARGFEEAVAERCGVKHAITLSSGTSALHLAVRGLGIGEGDEVLVPSFTFAASVNAILYERATPVFVDIEPETLNLSIEDCERRITPKTRAIMVVDVFGHPADWDGLETLARKHDLLLIDDCCEAIGSEYRGRPLGSLGNAGAFAFYPNKQITTGEGGMLVTDDDDLATLARSLRNQGRDAMGAWLDHPRLGFNYRMDELSAALGLSQFRRLDTFMERRAHVASLYNERLAGLPRVEAPTVQDHVTMSWFVYVVRLAEGLDRDPVMKKMEQRGIPVRGYFQPVHELTYARKYINSSTDGLPVTESMARRTVAIPFHNHLSEAAVDRVVEVLAEVLDES